MCNTSEQNIFPWKSQGNNGSNDLSAENLNSILKYKFTHKIGLLQIRSDEIQQLWNTNVEQNDKKS